MPAIVAFGAGLVIDVMTSGPLGFWPLIYLTGLGLTLVAGPWLERVLGLRWLSFAVIAVQLAALQWLIASAYYATAADFHPILAGTIAAIAVEPLLAWLFAAALPSAEARPSWSRAGG